MSDEPKVSEVDTTRMLRRHLSVDHHVNPPVGTWDVDLHVVHLRLHKAEEEHPRVKATREATTFRA